jgi:hypothetical protein
VTSLSMVWGIPIMRIPLTATSFATIRVPLPRLPRVP